MADRTSAEERTQIEITLPLPLDVASTLMTLIGTAYPDATVENTNYRMNIWIPKGARAVDVTPAEIAEAKFVRTDVLDDTQFRGSDGGWIHMSPPEELQLHLGNIAHIIFSGTEGAINYVEWQVRTEEDDNYILSISKSKEQTPHALLTAAKKRIAELEAQLLELIDK